MTSTTNLNMTLPTIGADLDNWGTELNANLGIIDTFATLPTRQVLTSGTNATYTTPANCRQLRIRMVGGGGGGGGFNGATNGGIGGDTVFKDIIAKGGGGETSGGIGAAGSGGAAGNGGSNGTGAAGVFRSPGGDGQNSWITEYAGGASSSGSLGGSSMLGGGACAGVAKGYGGGGTGATPFGAGNGGGGGGGAGEFVEFIIDGPNGSYTFSIGAGGAGASFGSVNGSAGKQGAIILDELY